MKENNDSDIHRSAELTALKLTRKARQHDIRVSKNATDSPIERPKGFRNFKASKDTGSVV